MHTAQQRRRSAVIDRLDRLGREIKREIRFAASDLYR
jgi:hypothetical protein